MAKVPLKALGLKRALELLQQPDHRLMVMHSPASPEGRAYFVVPGGYVEPTVALKILEHPKLQPFDDGLFPNCPQSWRFVGAES